MSPQNQRIIWSADESAIVRTVEELDITLENLAQECDSGKPIIIIVEGPNGKPIYYGIGREVSFVSSCDEPYFTTLGNEAADGELNFYFQGHYTPIAVRNLIPANATREIVREFFVSGQFAPWQRWEIIGQ